MVEKHGGRNKKMQMSMVQEMLLCPECQVCKSLMINNLDAKDRFEAALKGTSTKYNRCKCGRIMLSPECDDVNYRRRWRYWDRKVIKESKS